MVGEAAITKIDYQRRGRVWKDVFIDYRWSSQRDWFSRLSRDMSISLATPRACLVSSDNFPPQASSMIWKIFTKKDQRKNAQNSDN